MFGLRYLIRRVVSLSWVWGSVTPVVPLAHIAATACAFLKTMTYAFGGNQRQRRTVGTVSDRQGRLAFTVYLSRFALNTCYALRQTSVVLAGAASWRRRRVFRQAKWTLTLLLLRSQNALRFGVIS
jgi:hypothetical protein